MNFFSNINLRTKLVIMVAVLTLPIMYLSYIYINDNMASINKRKLESVGMEYQALIQPLFKFIAQHRGATAGYLGGEQELLDKVNQVENVVDENLASLQEFHTKYQEIIVIDKVLNNILKDWQYIKDNNLTLRKRENFELHSKLIDEVKLVLESIAYQSNISLDADYDILSMADIVFVKLPNLLEELGKLRGITSGLAARQYLEDGENTLITLHMIGVESALFELEKSIQQAISSSPEVEALLSVNLEENKTLVKDYLNLSEKLLNDVTYLMTADSSKQFNNGTKVITAWSELYSKAIPKINMFLEQRTSAMQTQLYVSLAIAFFLFMFAVLLSFLIMRDIGINFSKIKNLFRGIQDGNYENEIEVIGKTEFSSIFSSLRDMQVGLYESREQDQREARINGRIKQALENATSSVVVANSEMDIIYINEAARSMFKNAERSIQQDIPEFQADRLMDMNIDEFHKSPQQHRRTIEQMTSSLDTSIGIGDRKFSVIFTPVNNDQGERIGTVMEWRDQTAELAIQSDVQSLVQAALEGDLSRRLDLEDKQGFLKFLSEGINNLVDVSERVVNDMIRVLGAMSQGDLTEKIDQEYQGKFNQLKDDANATINTLTEIVSKIKESSSLVNSASSEISEGNLNLSDRTEVQAASLEETSANMTEMTSTVQQNAQNAKQANELAIGAREQAEKGGAVVNNAVTAMSEINQASNKIADIISVIDEIAFQTNLLALNAAVEAARAGEQGRGFAVVASEVRNLAGRSATAAKEIKELIEDSVLKVEEGTRLVNQSGETLDEIMNSVKEVTDIIGDISVASQEQASGIEQVNQTIMQMDESTQQNAALVEEASASAESMNEQSDELNNLVDFFKVSKAQVDHVSSFTQVEKDNSISTPVIERRSKDRPWSNKSQQAEAANEQDLGFEDEASWEEF